MYCDEPWSVAIGYHLLHLHAPNIPSCHGGAQGHVHSAQQPNAVVVSAHNPHHELLHITTCDGQG